MKSKLFLIVSMFAIFGMLLSACAPNGASSTNTCKPTLGDEFSDGTGMDVTLQNGESISPKYYEEFSDGCGGTWALTGSGSLSFIQGSSVSDSSKEVFSEDPTSVPSESYDNTVPQEVFVQSQPEITLLPLPPASEQAISDVDVAVIDGGRVIALANCDGQEPAKIVPVEVDGMKAEARFCMPDGEFDKVQWMAVMPLTLANGVPGDEVIVGGLFLASAGVWTLAKVAVVSSDTISFRSNNPVTTSFPITDNPYDNSWWSVDHDESLRLIEGIKTRADDHNRLNTKGDCVSSGSICIKGSVSTGRAIVAFVVASGPNMYYMAAEAPLTTNPGDGKIPFGDGTFINPKKLVWTCAWWFSTVIGRDKKPDSSLLTAGQGWERWLMIESKYGPFFNIASIELPKTP